jgi:sulfate transport system permease protein
MSALVLKNKNRSILPGFGLSMGYTALYVSLIVIIPLAGLFFKSATMSWAAIHKAITDPDLISSLKLTFGLSLIAGLINVVFGFIAAWTLVRYPFPGRKLLDALIDLPFALPTAVSGITLATLYSRNGWLGKPWLWIAQQANSLLNWIHPPAAGADPWIPDQIAYTRLGMLIALIFIGVPFMVRTLEPALSDLDPEAEEAAASLGASRSQAFRRVVLPALMPAVVTGFSLSFARAIGEYGSVIFISANIPGESQITAHLIMKKLENNDEAGATTLGIVMLVISFLLLITINGLQWWSTRRSRLGVV